MREADFQHSDQSKFPKSYEGLEGELVELSGIIEALEVLARELLPQGAYSAPFRALLNAARQRMTAAEVALDAAQKGYLR
ncbi:hypothetical protein [Pannonibacter tanglangensis]|nr:hypothetical protein [Pannonibacter sp. XCT-34]